MNRRIIGVTVGTTMGPEAIASKLKPVKSVNGVTPDENGNVEVGANIPEWAKQPEKPSYTADEVGAQPKGDYLTEESDPTVPAWAKEPAKPGYTAEEVGADPSGSAQAAQEAAKKYTDEAIGKIPTPDVSGQIGAHNTAPDAHTDIRQQIAGIKVPTKVSALENDAGYLKTVPGEYVTETELAEKGYLTEHQDLSDYAKRDEIPDTSAFITKAVSDLVNYYTKAQTYSRDEIDQRISTIPKFSIEVVSSLPTSGISETTIYLLSTGSGSDLYTEYIRVNGVWEILGSQRVDLTGYATQAWTLAELAGYQVKGDYALKSELPTKLAQLTGDSTHRLVTDAEKSTWNAKLDAAELPDAVNDALAQAKASGEFDGVGIVDVTIREV